MKIFSVMYITAYLNKIYRCNNYVNVIRINLKNNIKIPKVTINFNKQRFIY